MNSTDEEIAMKQSIIKKLRLLGLTTFFALGSQVQFASATSNGYVSNDYANSDRAVKIIITPTSYELVELEVLRISSEFRRQNTAYITNFDLQFAELNEMFALTVVLADDVSTPVAEFEEDFVVASAD